MTTACMLAVTLCYIEIGNLVKPGTIFGKSCVCAHTHGTRASSIAKSRNTNVSRLDTAGKPNKHSAGWYADSVPLASQSRWWAHMHAFFGDAIMLQTLQSVIELAYQHLVLLLSGNVRRAP
jgi:hypothetical protein